VGFNAGPLLPLPYVLVLFVCASLWVLWAAWMFSGPVAGRVRWGVLALLLLLTTGTGLAVKVEGLTGDARGNFAWRWDLAQRERRAVDLGPEQTAAAAVDLTSAGEQDYSQYLGPLRLGVAPRARLARDWDKRPPRLLWRQPVGTGWGSFALVG